jgi:hypothetical protein
VHSVDYVGLHTALAIHYEHTAHYTVHSTHHTVHTTHHVAAMLHALQWPLVRG